MWPHVAEQEPVCCAATLLLVSAAGTDAVAAPCRAPSPLNRHRAAVAVLERLLGTSPPAGHCSRSGLAAGNRAEAAEPPVVVFRWDSHGKQLEIMRSSVEPSDCCFFY